MGVYAGSASSYERFGALFDRVVGDYHGQGRHVEDRDASKLELEFSSEEKTMIKSTRIRFSRNFATFPLPPAINKE